MVLAARTRTRRVFLCADAHGRQGAVVAANRWRQFRRWRYVVRTLGRKLLAGFLSSDDLATSERHIAVTNDIGWVAVFCVMLVLKCNYFAELSSSMKNHQVLYIYFTQA